MKLIAATTAGFLLVIAAGCAPGGQGGSESLHSQLSNSTRPSNSPDDIIVARANGQIITLHQLMDPLIESYGLNELMNLVQLQMVRYEASKNNMAVTREDVRAERARTLDLMFKDSHGKQQIALEDAEARGDKGKADAIRAEMRADDEQLLSQYLEERKISRADFEIALETNAYLRKLATPLIKDKLTDDDLQQAFNAQFGEKAQVHIIQSTARGPIQEAQRRLARGDSFEAVARELSEHKQSAALGGELPLFTRQSVAYPAGFKEVAFSLKEGEVSDIVQASESFFLIKLIKKIPPRIVKFDDVKEGLRGQLYELWMDRTIKELRSRLADTARKTIEIQDPVLKRQFEQKMSERDAAIKDPDQIREEIHRSEQKLTTAPSLLPAATNPAEANPTSGSTTMPLWPATAPPATQPATPGILDVLPPPPATAP